ncbi:glycine-rich RNA-binding protein RZ1C isoform X2 [Asparagus officinalis]|nr:glycine-rich RNA-binding protein RZ1C isoform X2 [Asparagus officinalis]
MLERDTGRPRGFGFVTFTDRRAMEDAIAEMHGQDLGGRNISVNKAQPKMGSDDPGYGYSGGERSYSSGARGGYRGGGDRDRDRPSPLGGSSDCFKCGRPGHWARECPSASGSGAGSRLPSRSRFGGGGGGRGDRFGGGDRYVDRYVDDRYDGGRFGDRDRFESRDTGRYGSSGGRDRYGSDRYGSDRYAPSGGDRYDGGGGGQGRAPFPL